MHGHGLTPSLLSHPECDQDLLDSFLFFFPRESMEVEVYIIVICYANTVQPCLPGPRLKGYSGLCYFHLVRLCDSYGNKSVLW